MTREFEHYPGCGFKDPDNCSGCALTDTRQARPNYAAWPLVYMENRRPIPAKWRKAFIAEINRKDNPAYAANVKATMERLGVRFTDGRDVNGELPSAGPAYGLPHPWAKDRDEWKHEAAQAMRLKR